MGVSEFECFGVCLGVCPSGVSEFSEFGLGVCASSTFIESQSFYAPGWDSSSVEADPKLNENYLPAATGPAANGAIDLNSVGFPGLKGDVFRGASDANGAEIIGR